MCLFCGLDNFWNVDSRYKQLQVLHNYRYKEALESVRDTLGQLRTLFWLILAVEYRKLSENTHLKELRKLAAV